MNTDLNPWQYYASNGNTFEEESEFLKEFFDDPHTDVEIYISEHLWEAHLRVI